MRQIERITLEGFKSIRELSTEEGDLRESYLELRDINLLIGANGTGKSNFLSFFSLLQAIVGQRLQSYVGISGGASRLLYFGRKISESIHAKIEFGEHDNETWYEFKLVPAVGEDLVFVNGLTEDWLRFGAEILFWQNPNSFSWGDKLGPPNVIDGGKPGSLETEGLRHENDTSKRIRERFTLLGPLEPYHFADTGSESRVRQRADLDDNRRLRQDGRNLAPFLHLLQSNNTSAYERIVDAIRLVFPFIDRFVLEPMKSNPRLIELEWKESGTDDYRDAFYLSDGALRFICLATLLLQPEPPGLILIDEPELGLHPSAIGLLAELLQDVSRASQVIVATQSVTLVNHFTPRDLVIVERAKESGSLRYETIFKRKTEGELAEWLEDYSLGDLWEKNLLGGRPTHA